MANKFLGASIVSFSETMGWGSQDSSLETTLVECIADGDVFSPPIVGSPVIFDFGGHIFNGIVDKFSQNDSSGGHPIFSVNLTNGSQMLEGVQLITDDYFGQTNSVPNLVNVFGYLENSGGYGASGKNDAGLSWIAIRDAILNVVNSSGTPYGAPITYKGYNYGIDLSTLPNIPSYYRISSDNLSLLDYISEVCDAGGTDFFLKLTPYTGGVLPLDGVFGINTISRLNEAVDGTIINYITNSTGCIESKEIGLESRYDTTSKFVLGANYEAIYYNFPQFLGNDDGTPANFIDNTIMPYFGMDDNGNCIIGYGDYFTEDYFFDINIKDLGAGNLGGVYTTSTGELAASKKGRDTWEAYLAKKNFNQYEIVPSGVSTAFFIVDPNAVDPFLKYRMKFGYWFLANRKGVTYADTIYSVLNEEFITYHHSGELNPYYQRASSLKMVEQYAYHYMHMFEDDMATKSAAAYLEFKEAFSSRMNNADLRTRLLDRASGEKETFSGNNAYIERTNELYKRIKDLAEEYYNRKFMVRIPFTLGAVEPESFNIRLSQTPINEGYLDEAAWPTAFASGLIPDYSGINDLTNEENKFVPYIKFENAITKHSTTGTVTNQNYDFSEISEADKVYNTVPSGAYDIYDVFIKCGVDETIVFVDSSTLYSPRAVLTVPGPIKPTNDANKSEHMLGELRKRVNLATSDNMVFFGDAEVDNDYIIKQLSKVGIDTLKLESTETVVFADLYAVPLRDNLNSYGPWWAIGASGKVEYERNTELNPWNYGGYDAMNLAGFARANDSLTNQTFAEAGSMTFVGAPVHQLGDVLLSDGPYVTSINVNFGDGGITTQYQFQTWSSHKRFNKLNNYNANRIQRLSKKSRELRRNFREGIKNGAWSSPQEFMMRAQNKFLDLNQYARRHRSNSSHSVLAGQNSSASSTVVTQPVYNTQNQAGNDWENKAFMSMDGLFRPFSTVPHSGMNYFEEPFIITSGTDFYAPTSINLNPLSSGHDISIVSSNTTPPSGGLDAKENMGLQFVNDVAVYRGLGLKLPLVGVGYSLDVNGYNVQHSGDANREWSDDYLYNKDNWKAGPIDIRWDGDLKIYCAPKLMMGIAKENIPDCTSILMPTSGLVSRYIPNVLESGSIGSTNMCFQYDSTLGAINKGTVVTYYNIEGINIITSAACDTDTDALGLV